jgi:hypothetical protein
MISNDVLKADLVAALKGHATLTDLLVRQDGEGGAENVKESQYAGTVFTYPAVRVRINRQIFIPERGPCDHARVIFLDTGSHGGRIESGVRSDRRCRE